MHLYYRMVLTQQLNGTIISNTGSGTQSDPVIIQGENVDFGESSSYGEVTINVEPGTKGTLYVKFRGDNYTLIQTLENSDSTTQVNIFLPSGEYERNYVDINRLSITFFLYARTKRPFTVEYYYSAQTSTPSPFTYPTLNWQVRRPRYSNNALVFYKSGTASGAVGSVVNSRVISRRT